MGKYEANDTGVSVKIKWNKLTRTSMGEKATIRISKLQKKVRGNCMYCYSLNIFHPGFSFIAFLIVLWNTPPNIGRSEASQPSSSWNNVSGTILRPELTRRTRVQNFQMRSTMSIHATKFPSCHEDGNKPSGRSWVGTCDVASPKIHPDELWS